MDVFPGFINEPETVGGGSLTIQDEGAPLGGGPHTTINFTGPGVIATNAGGGVADVTISGGGTTVEEVILTLTDNNLTAGVAMSIQTGIYAGGGPATVEGTATLTLPATFITDANIIALLNGQEIKKGTDVLRASSTQVTFSEKLKTTDQVKIRIFS